jgi:DNA excision repair protein ERCC-2
MRFDLDGLDVFFPYDRIYLEQHQYMRSLKQSLDASGHCLLEMPTGTGKTVCLLSLITSYQFANPSAGKLVYCTRTVPEMNHVVEELGTVLAYRAEQLALREQSSDQEMEEMSHDNRKIEKNNGNDGPAKKKPKRIVGKPKRGREHTLGPISTTKGAGGSGVLALCLSSRRNMCVHERVMAESDREAVDAACRSMTASWVVEQSKQKVGSMETCSYYDKFQEAGEATNMPSGVYDLEELKKWVSSFSERIVKTLRFLSYRSLFRHLHKQGKERGWCPYYLTRQAINHGESHLITNWS